jgi:hypothetical protein
VNPQISQDLSGAFAHRLSVDKNAGSYRLATKEKVGGDVALVDERKILEHGGDAEITRVMRIGNTDLLAADLDGAAVRLMHAAQDLHQGGLASAIVADDRQDFPSAEIEINLVQSLDSAEGLRQAAAFDKRLLGHSSSLPLQK